MGAGPIFRGGKHASLEPSVRDHCSKSSGLKPNPVVINAGRSQLPSILLEKRHHSQEASSASGGNINVNTVASCFEFSGATGAGDENIMKNELRNSNFQDINCISAHRLPSPIPLHWQLEENNGKSKLTSKRPFHHECNPSHSRTINQACMSGPGNKYKLQGLLGKGTFSTVYQISESKSMQPYALKIIRKKKPGAVQWRQLDVNHYETEIRILRSCRTHQNIILLHQVMTSATHVFMILELADGGDLFDRLKTRGRFSEDQSQHTLCMILAGVSYLHRNGITHRDLKLENLLYKSQDLDSNILISDFGLAHQSISVIRACDQQQWSCDRQQQSCDRQQQSCDHWDKCGMSTTCGTAEYLSPEMLEGEVYSEKVDIWAVGVVMYAIMSGRMAFSEEGGRARMYQRIKEGKYSLEDEVSCKKEVGSVLFVH